MDSGQKNTPRGEGGRLEHAAAVARLVAGSGLTKAAAVVDLSRDNPPAVVGWHYHGRNAGVAAKVGTAG
jgi:hypothetical protein